MTGREAPSEEEIERVIERVLFSPILLELQQAIASHELRAQMQRLDDIMQAVRDVARND